MCRTSYARHVRGCRENQEGAVADVGGRSEAGGGRDELRERTRGRVAESPLCGRMLPYIKIARHQKSCRVWDLGGE